MKKRIFLNVLIPALVLSSCGGNQGNKVAGYVPEVRVFAVDSSCISHVLKEFVGKADDSFTAVLSFPVSGNVGKIYVREGGRVEAGDLVAELDPRTAENALAAARASYDRAEDGYRRPEADSSVSERKPESRPAFTSPLQQAQMRETPSAGPRKLTRMTAAPVSSAAEQDFSDFQIGMRVRHGRFGEGVILSFDGDGNNRKALIEFDNSGQKQLFLKFARLEKM